MDGAPGARQAWQAEEGEEVKHPLCIELFSGTFGWSAGWLEMGGRSIGFDIDHQAYHGPIPAGAELVLQDVLTLHGSQFKDADLILASPPCQAYSYRAMPWKRAKALPPPSNELFDACFRIQLEASAAAGRVIPMVVENVKGAQPWVGRAKWHFGSFYLWGDVPALMPITLSSMRKIEGFNFHQHEKTGKPGGSFQSAAVKGLGSWFGESHGKQLDCSGHPRKLHGFEPPQGVKVPGITFKEGFNVSAAKQYRAGIKQEGSGAAWLDKGIAKHSSRSNSRRAASAAIARVPLELSRHIARVYFPS